MPNFVCARRFTAAATAAAFVALLARQPAWGWGADGHRMINRVAAASLPADVPQFLRDANGLDVIEWLGPEPDRWRNRAEEELDQEQSPDHFINMETANLIGPLPRKRYDFIRALAAAQSARHDTRFTPERVGMQPWQTEEVWEKLKVDFREYRRLLAANGDTVPVQTAVLYDAGVLGHYVGDGSQPMHTSLQYNGWTGPNPHGYTTDRHVHSKFETVYVSENVKREDIASIVGTTRARPIADEWTQYLAYLRHSNSLIEKTYQLEKLGAFDGQGTPAGRAFVDERIAAGAIELRDLIYAAWVHSADPVEEY